MNYFVQILFLALFCSACATQQPFLKEIEQYRAEKIKENTKGDRHPLEPGDEKWIQFFEPKAQYKVIGTFEPATDTSMFDMLTYSGATRLYQRYGKVTFQLDGQPLQLTLYRNKTLMAQKLYRDYLFMPFKDASNGKETYSGGRYLDLRTTDLNNGTIVLDFNKVYNPWCAYSDGYSCPVPPKENHLSVAVLAGERNYLGEKKH